MAGREIGRVGDSMNFSQHLVFGLDIGTRSVVGTVGYQEGNTFQVVAQYIKEHDTRAMLDGQIHDINKVGQTILEVKQKIEEQIGRPLKEVCIAAAGRVLRTVTVRVDHLFQEDTVITPEHIYSLDLLGVEKAHDELLKQNDTNIKFYCVGYTVIRYFLNENMIGNLENHKAKAVSAELIATFLPEEVVDGLYKSVALANLQVVNLTLEPIAAIGVAIPEMYRMLNIALVDVGAGTSDICITRDGSIVAYGMIPYAGDEMTEVIAKHCLVDFQSAEEIKLAATTKKKVIHYKDIMGISQKITPAEVNHLLEPVVHDIVRHIADKIKELNGEKTVSAVFVVGGGGKCYGFTDHLAEELKLPKERVALRGEEVLKEVNFQQKSVKKDPLLVTPIGICLNYYEQKNNFIFVQFNGERIKLYDNNHLTVADAAIQTGFPKDRLFPRRGKEISFYVNGKLRMVRGEPGENAIITLNGDVTSINARISANDKIQIIGSTEGALPATYIEQLPEYKYTITFQVQNKKIVCPKFVEVNKQLVSGYYRINDKDEIHILNYYTVSQVLEFMDCILEEDNVIYVNNKKADLTEKLYENFSLDWKKADEFEWKEEVQKQQKSESGPEDAFGTSQSSSQERIDQAQKERPVNQPEVALNVIVNKKNLTLHGKSKYTFVDIFDWIDFDLKNAQGKEIVTLLNGSRASFSTILQPDDEIEIYWKD